jgi:putative PIN family toxin of toxin-antitoxin system
MLNPKVVIDTNVLVSAVRKETGIPHLAVNTVLKKENFTLVYSSDIFLEYLDVLNRRRLKLPVVKVNTLLGLILKLGEKISPFPQFIHFHDESDKKFYEVFKTANADYLITGNIKDFPEERGIISPKAFAELLGILN